MNLKDIRFRTHDRCEALTEAILEMPALVRREKKLKVAAEQTLWRAGDAPLHVYRLETGIVELTETSEDGRVTSIEVVKPGQLFGYLCFCDHREEPIGREARARAQSVVLRTGYEDFRRALKIDPKAASMLTGALCARVAAAERRNRVLTIHNAQTRLATLLYQLARLSVTGAGEESNSVALHLSHAHLATQSSLTRPHTTVLMTRLRKMGCVAYERGSAITVHLPAMRNLLAKT